MAIPLHLLVIDLETRPDVELLPADRDPEAFPKPIQHEIITLGFLLARIEHDGESERYVIRKVGSASIADRGERNILAGFWRMVDRNKPRLVTWNGRGFDVAVLKQRSLVHGLAAYNWHRTDPRFGYDYRFQTHWHCDLMDTLCDYGASPRLGLDEAARALGLPGKWNGHGDEVADLVAAGDYTAIDRYCEGDVLNTYVLYLRWAHLNTRLSPRGHNASVQNLLDYLAAGREQNPHWGEFIDCWQASERPCPLFVNEPLGAPGPQLPESHLRSEDVLP
ncbi:MAG TPA: 3'-5' exonuclease [Candidatus Competibacter sp.]|jgi:predicted PolB exonuclease-like 3'-5' exonuclease|nr:3'-5' exonuclease [Candidatus Competibacter sp.]HRF62583.1 3'-5' exonuclease [Candidatus Competibacter sp.]HRX59958.1 3'-5' exonuclease [Candidatus Competibacter sp.]